MWRPMLYHWTHVLNLPSIRAIGLCDRYARTADGMLYAVKVNRILSGLKHVSDRHGWKPEKMVCLAFPVRECTRLGLPSGRFFRFAGTIPPEDISVIQFYWPAESLTATCKPGKPRPEPRRKRTRNTRSRPG